MVESIKTISKLLLLNLIIITGCNNPPLTSESTSSLQPGTGSPTCLRFEDAKFFLPSWSKENRVFYHMTDEPDGMHPLNSNSSMAAEIMYYTQVYLIGTDYCKSVARPVAVKTLPILSEDGKEYHYELRDDIRFDDGQVLSVDDVIFTFKGCKMPVYKQSSF